MATAIPEPNESKRPYLASRTRRLRDDPKYLWAVVSIAPLSTLANYVSPQASILKGQPASVLLTVLLTTLAVVLWLPYRSPGQLFPLAKFVLILVLSCWGIQTVETQLDGSLFSHSTFAVPIAVLLVLIKPPTYRDLLTAALLFAYLVIAIGVTGILLDLLDLAPSAFTASRTGYSRVPLLSDLTGIDTRWEGPYGNVNYAAPIGAYLVVFGAAMRGWNRVLVVGGGSLILCLSQGRSALFAMVAGLLVVGLSDTRISRLQHAALLRWIAGAGLVAVGILYIVAFDRTLANRTDVWRDFLSLWRESPVWGVGTSGVSDYVAFGSSVDVIHHTHAHSIFLDVLARYGILLFLLTILVTAACIVLGAYAAGQGSALGLAIVVVTITSGLIETTFSWAYLSILSTPLLLGILLSATYMTTGRNGNQLDALSS